MNESNEQPSTQASEEQITSVKQHDPLRHIKSKLTDSERENFFKAFQIGRAHV